MHVNSFQCKFLSLYFRHSWRNVCRRVHYRTMAAKRRWIHEAFLVWKGSQVFQSWKKLSHGKNCQSTSVGSCSLQVCLIFQGLKNMLFVKCRRIMISYIVHLCSCYHNKVKNSLNSLSLPLTSWFYSHEKILYICITNKWYPNEKKL